MFESSSGQDDERKVQLKSMLRTTCVGYDLELWISIRVVKRIALVLQTVIIEDGIKDLFSGTFRRKGFNRLC